MAVVCVCKAFCFFFFWSCTMPKKKGNEEEKECKSKIEVADTLLCGRADPLVTTSTIWADLGTNIFLKRVQLLGWNSTTEMTNTIYGWVKEKKRMFCVLLYSQVLIAKHIAAGLHSRTVKVSTIKRPMQRWRTNSKLPSWTLTYCRLGRKLCKKFFFRNEFFKPFMKMMSTFEQRGLAFFRMAFGGLMVVYSMRMIRYHHLALNQQSDGETWTIPHIP